MPRLLSLGVLAALFFSSTFVLNRTMSLEGGHWVWSASLRYAFTILLIVLVLLVSGQYRLLIAGLGLGRRYWRFWLLAGTIGFGVFYAGITFSAQYAAGWVVATTWQMTILMTPLVLWAFGRPVPRRGVFFALIIFGGIVLVNLETAAATSSRELLLGAVPVLVAAVAYPLGNQMVWEAKRGQRRFIPHIEEPILDNTLVRVLVIGLGHRAVVAFLDSVAATGRARARSTRQHSPGCTLLRPNRNGPFSVCPPFGARRLSDCRG